jgi:hypothetical protein
MPFVKLQFKPGINRDQTDYSNEGGWYECDKIRFRSGYPEKIGGWTKATPTMFLGVCRQMWNWVTTFEDNLLSLGTNNKAYIQTSGGAFYDITPLRDANPILSTPITDYAVGTTNGSKVVTITLSSAHAAVTGDFVTVSGVVGTGSPQKIGGIPVDANISTGIDGINGNHQITVVNTTTFTFTVDTAATSTTTSRGGTAIVLEFEITPGNAYKTAGYGWGTGTWGRGAWGTGNVSPVYLPQRDWWFDNLDNDLVMNIRNGRPYYWERGTLTDPAPSLNTRAIELQTYASNNGFDPALVPVTVMQLMVSQQANILIAFGAVPYGSTLASDFDPLLIRWSALGSPGDWSISSFNPNGAGYLRVSRGSKIIRALPTRQETLVWTDTNLYTLQFLGTTSVFALQEYADNISIMSPRSMASAANITYWMGQDKFYAYTGRVETLPCTLRDHVFNNINLNQADQVICGTNEQWNEIWWFYPTADSDYNNAYVVYNHLERIWYYGSIDRTAWLDTPLRHWPQAANTAFSNNQFASSGYIYNHEDGIDADGAPMDSSSPRTLT